MKILLGLTGSVASILYKKLIVKLQTLEEVNVLLTPSALHFVNDLSLPKLLNGGKVYIDEDEWRWKIDGGYVTEWKKEYSVLHIDLKNTHGIFVIAPCSANTLAKIANGLCDNLLTSVARAWDRNRPFVIAPAMNRDMWEHPITQKHIETFRNFSYNNLCINPQTKLLACGTYGMGAMEDIDKIVNTVKESLRWRFPISYNGYEDGFSDNCSGIPIKNHPGAFGTQRTHEKHTGIDLYTDENTPVMAVEDGTLVCIEPFTGPKDNSPWWLDTSCILIEGASGVICYGEIEPLKFHIGCNISRGTIIGYVKRVIREGKEHPEVKGWRPSMLHMEVYPHGTYKPSNGFDEKILIDPTPYLMNAYDAPKKLLTLTTTEI